MENFLIRASVDWSLRGHRWFINPRESTAFTDQSLNDNSRVGLSLSTDKDAEFSWQETSLVETNVAERRIINIENSVGLAISAEPSNWGSFLLRVVPKLALFKQYGIQEIIMWSGVPQMRSMAKILGFSDENIIAHGPICDYKFARESFIASQRHSDGYIDPYSRNIFSNIAQSFKGKSRFKKNIYISRKQGVAQGRSRRCINEEEICAALTRIGFDIVVPDLLSVDEQIAVFANADFVIGLAGAGLFNVVFCLPGTKLIDIESEQHWIFAHTNLFSSLGLRYGVFWGNAQTSFVDKPQAHIPFTVNVDNLVRRAKIMLEDNA